VLSREQHLSDIGAWLGFDSFLGDLSVLRIRQQESAIKPRGGLVTQRGRDGRRHHYSGGQSLFFGNSTSRWTWTDIRIPKASMAVMSTEPP
jgi:hypothetical protein